MVASHEDTRLRFGGGTANGRQAALNRVPPRLRPSSLSSELEAAAVTSTAAGGDSSGVVARFVKQFNISEATVRARFHSNAFMKCGGLGHRRANCPKNAPIQPRANVVSGGGGGSGGRNPSNPSKSTPGVGRTGAASQGPSSRVGPVSGGSGQATQSSSFIEELIVLPGSVNVRSSDRLLIDGGVTSNFVAAAFVQQHNMGPVRPQKPVAVRMANGQPVQCKAALRQAQVAVHGHAGYYDLLMMPDLDGFDAILGRPFLRDAGAIVHHREAKICTGAPSSP